MFPTTQNQRIAVRKSRGQTFPEMMIVVAIIAILAAVIIANLFHARAEAQVSSVEETLHTLSAAEEMYFNDYGSYYTANGGGGVSPALFGGDGNPYYNSTPTVISAQNGFRYSYAYTYIAPSQTYTFCTQAEPGYGRDMPSIKKSDGTTLTDGTLYNLCFSTLSGIYAQ